MTTHDAPIFDLPSHPREPFICLCEDCIRQRPNTGHEIADRVELKHRLRRDLIAHLCHSRTQKRR